ncbi:MAG: tautomerase family protein [Planctomycetes bacterium]|nr:tautomerase family protein [Planctomycetota bacterium]
MPIIDVTLFEGRDVATKRALVERLTAAAAESLAVPAASVTVVLREIARHDLAEGGVLFAERERA